MKKYTIFCENFNEIDVIVDNDKLFVETEENQNLDLDALLAQRVKNGFTTTYCKEKKKPGRPKGYKPEKKDIAKPENNKTKDGWTKL